MKTPAELMDALRRHESAESAIAVWKEAQGYIKQFEEVKAAALDCARSEAEITGAVHQKFEHGSAGWTQPKTPRLNRDKWAAAMVANPDLETLQLRFEAAQAALEQAQSETGCLELPEPRFYIK